MKTESSPSELKDIESTKVSSNIWLISVKLVHEDALFVIEKCSSKSWQKGDYLASLELVMKAKSFEISSGARTGFCLTVLTYTKYSLSSS